MGSFEQSRNIAGIARVKAHAHAQRDSLRVAAQTIRPAANMQQFVPDTRRNRRIARFFQQSDELVCAPSSDAVAAAQRRGEP